jgi:hypothetical protein
MSGFDTWDEMSGFDISDKVPGLNTCFNTWDDILGFETWDKVLLTGVISIACRTKDFGLDKDVAVLSQSGKSVSLYTGFRANSKNL